MTGWLLLLLLLLILTQPTRPQNPPELQEVVMRGATQGQLSVCQWKLVQ